MISKERFNINFSLDIIAMRSSYTRSPNSIYNNGIIAISDRNKVACWSYRMFLRNNPFIFYQDHSAIPSCRFILLKPTEQDLTPQSYDRKIYEFHFQTTITLLVQMPIMKFIRVFIPVK